MDKFWVVTLFHFQPTENERGILESTAVEQFEALGGDRSSAYHYWCSSLKAVQGGSTNPCGGEKRQSC